MQFSSAAMELRSADMAAAEVELSLSKDEEMVATCCVIANIGGWPHVT
jgi:hypothetical protein